MEFSVYSAKKYTCKLEYYLSYYNKVGADYQVVSDVLIGASWVQYFDINKTDLDYQAVSIKAKIAF